MRYWSFIQPGRGAFVSGIALGLILVASTAVAETERDALRVALDLNLEQGGPILVHRDDVVLTGADLAGFLETIPVEHRRGFLQGSERVGRVLENLLLQRTLVKQAAESGFLDTPEMQGALLHAAGAEIARRYLRHLSEQAMLESYEQQARELFLRDPERFRQPSTWNFRHLLLRVTNPGQELETVQRIAELEARIQAGTATLEELALAYSEDETVSDNAGLHERIELSQLDPQFANALEALSPGQVSGPVRSQFGWHLIELLERKDGGIPEFDEIRLDAEFLARERHQDSVIERVSSELFMQGGDLDQEALEAFLEEYLARL